MIRINDLHFIRRGPSRLSYLLETNVSLVLIELYIIAFRLKRYEIRVKFDPLIVFTIFIYLFLCYYL
jgi:hypothetical protein